VNTLMKVSINKIAQLELGLPNDQTLRTKFT